jgi:hypothetical protein
VKRKAHDLTMQGADPALWMRDPRTKDAGFVLMPLSEPVSGRSNCTLSFSNTAGVEDISIVNGSGELVWYNQGTWLACERSVGF